jgi:ribonuclease HIII
MSDRNNSIEATLQELNIAGMEFKSIKEINYGYQIDLGDKNNLRVYYNKKGKRTIDTSQVKNTELRNLLQNAFSIKKMAHSSLDSKTINVVYPNIGTDESGKGDYFGPLVIAGVLLNQRQKIAFDELGIKDSKKISDSNIMILAKKIKKLVKTYNVIAIGNKRYNEFYNDVGNINTILAWGHAKVIENILQKNSVMNAYADQFGNKSLIENSLQKNGKKLKLTQLHKAEFITSVAAASILARERFLIELSKMSFKCGHTILKGASQKVNELGVKLVSEYGENVLDDISKRHFKNTNNILDE